ncbi:photosynthetic reaction center subunit H [Roseibium denhamense]|uniref:Photosynthetic reaction center H subunit n=1 Tax=Roseibium denhamense TaxID=76305 RepID=A0ABY1PKZ4_9HYPH|nr:photosynthetic reaction center subunit H [Roseibium denhamense]MTI07080.1 photosynthetic reaction center subunit H [Roseibium denhamense]SMP36325.1 photosynthetic reaction center H subunit [Roseibium denhamense]
MTEVVGSIDVAQVVLYVFWLFFAGLIFYIRQEDRREGYPLEDDVSGKFNKDPWLFVPPKKTFILPHGRGTVQVPDFKRDGRPVNAKRMSPAPGYPSEPEGNPLLSGVGPASWVQRQDIPDLTAHGGLRIVPLRADEEFGIAAGETEPRGLPVFGCDKKKAGTIQDVWVDRSEQLIRYYEVAMEDGKTVLLPNNFAVIKVGRAKKKYIFVEAIRSDQFADVPATAKLDAITRLEEDKITAYYGGGMLYAMRSRQEALV